MIRNSLSLVVLFVLLAGCTSFSLDNTRSREKILDDTLRSYAATIRWGEMTQAEAFVDPEYRKTHPLSETDRGRYKQIQISEYNEQPPVVIDEDHVTQTVEISLINVNTQRMRSIVDHQTWRYDEATKNWWLTSGLPDITQRD